MLKIGRYVVSITLVTAILAAGAFFLSCDSAEADSNVYVDEDGGAEYTLFGGLKPSVRVTGWDEIHTDVSIKDSIIINGHEYHVKSVSADAFKGKGITSVVMPDAVAPIDIYDNAFEGCSKLKTVTFGNSVTVLGNHLFKNCSSLETFHATGIRVIQLDVFNGCSSLRDVVLNNGMVSIGESAFRNCSSLVSISLPNTITGIGPFAFAGCESLKTINIPQSLTVIPTSLFEGCTSLESIVIPGSVESFKSRAFKDCLSLSSIVFEDGIVSIGAMELFKNCSFKTVNLPASVSYLYLDKYDGKHLMWPDSLKEFNVAESNPTFSSVDGVLYDKNKTTALLCPRGITGSLTINACIDDYSFYRSSLDSITLTSNVKSVGSNAFAYSSISNVILPEEEIVFGNSVFYSCAKLSSINLSSSSKELPDGMFTDCPLLILTELPKNIQRIGTAAFRNCTNVNINGFPESLRYIGEMAFLNSGIENVSLGAATDVVVGRAAFNTDSLKTATLGKVSLDGVDKAQYRYVFYGKNLESITTTENFKLWSQTGPLSIGSDGELFACLPKYEGTVIVPDGVTSVLNAFHGCYGLTEIIFHDLTSTVTIGSSYHSPGSFNGCVSLSSVVLPNVILAENNTFNGCTSLERVSIKTIDRIGNFMFKGTKLSELNFDYSKTIYVGMSAFENMNIKSFDASGMEVAKYAFKGCRELTSFVTDANTVLNTGALSYTGIKSITIYLDNPVKLDLSYGMSTMSGVASRLCEGCDSLSEINFEVGNSSNLVIGERTFSGCTSLKHIVMPQSLNTIYLYDESFKASGLESFGVQCNSILAVNGCFEDCSSLKSVVLNTVLPFTVASHAFANCTSLSELRGNTGSIDMSAFVGCTALNVIKLGGKSIINSDKNNAGFNIEDYHMATVDIGGYSGSYEGLLALLEYPSIKEFSCTELNDSYSVADGAVYQLTDGTPTCLLMCSESVESVIVPNTVRTIGEHAFDRCYNLSEVVFPGTISSFEYVPHSGPSFHSADGTTIDSSLLEFLNGHRFTKKNSVEGLVANPIITFVVDGSIIDTVLYVWGEEYLEPAVPEKTGYDGFWQDYDPTLGDLRVNATYSPHMHTVQYVLDGETYGSVENHAFSESVSLRDIPKRTGYSFSSWSADNVEIVDGKFVMGDADVVMVSASSLNHHTVTYRLDGVQMGDPETYGYGFEVTVRETPVKPGCEATPWVSNVEVSIAENKFVMGDDDVVFDSKSIKIVVAEEDGSATVELSGGETAFRASAGIKTVRVLMGEGKGVTVGDASPVIGKVVDCQLKSKINTSDVSGIAYEFVFTADGTPYGGTMQVTLPYVGEDGKGPAVYFWDGSKSTRMNIISSTDTSVTFETDHNSEYIVASEYISAESGFGGVAIILIIVVVAILCIGAMFAIRHRRTSV